MVLDRFGRATCGLGKHENQISTSANLGNGRCVFETLASRFLLGEEGD